MKQYISILGRLPKLSLAELEAVFGAQNIQPFTSEAAIINSEVTAADYARLGGSLKLAKILAELPNDWPSIEQYLSRTLPEHASYTQGKLTLGISLYGLRVPVPKLQRSILGFKKLLKSSGKPVRVILNKNLELSTAEVYHNKLTTQNAWELLIVSSGKQTYLAQTIFVQDIDSYVARDRGRPKRDSRVGMLPPKLAQTIINLAVDEYGVQGTRYDNNGLVGASNGTQPALEAVSAPRGSTQRAAVNYGEVNTGLLKPEMPKKPAEFLAQPDSRSAGAVCVLDPFCGTGVVLQEALLMGYSAYGSDLEPRMIDYSRGNLDWLLKNDERRTRNDAFSAVVNEFCLEVGDATNYRWDFSKLQTQGSKLAIACETYLGPPLTKQISDNELSKMVAGVDRLHEKFLINLASQISTNTRLCLAVPAWRRGVRGYKKLPVLEKLEQIGYNWVKYEHCDSKNLFYDREDQFVARQLVTITKQ